MEDEEEDREIIINKLSHDYSPEAVTLGMLRNYSKEDTVISNLISDVERGKLRPELAATKYKHVFKELSCVQGMLLRGNRVVIPQALQADVLALAHEGHPGVVSFGHSDHGTH